MRTTLLLLVAGLMFSVQLTFAQGLPPGTKMVRDQRGSSQVATQTKVALIPHDELTPQRAETSARGDSGEMEVSLGPDPPRSAGWGVILADGFEGASDPGWQVFTVPGSTDASWALSTARAWNGSWSAWCAGSGSQASPPGGTYPTNMNAWMMYGPFDLSPATDATLEFYYWTDTEPGYDKLFWGASLDGNTFWGEDTSDFSGGWQYLWFDLKNVPTLGNVTGNSQVWIAFVFVSDESVTGLGAYIDDVLLQKFVPFADSEPPAITVFDAPTSAPAGSSITVRANADDPSGIQDFFLIYFVGSDYLRFFVRNETIGQVVRFDATSGGSATIPGTAVNESGLHYVIAAIDNAGNINSEGHSVAVSVQAGAFTHSTVAGSEQSAYRLFSVPLELQNRAFNAFFSGGNDLGANGTEWRFFAYGGGQFNEYTGSSTAQITPGRGYFLVTKNSKAIRTAAGSTFRPSAFVSSGIPLSSGWNLVGNPFPYDIRLADFILEPQTDNLVDITWYWSGPGGWTKTNLALKPWDGLAMRVSGNTSLRLAASTGGSTLSKRSVRSESWTPGLSAFEQIEHIRRGTETEWRVQIIARDDDLTDEVNYLGVKTDALDGYDRYDLHEPPILPDFVSFHFRRDDWGEKSDLYAADIRSPSARGHVWVATIVGKPYSNVEVEFSGLEQVPEDFDLYAVAENGMVHNLRSRPTIELNTVEGKRTLMLIIGTSDFVRSNSGGINLIPRAFALHQNYPNPFNPSTTIRYELPMQAHVTLKVYSVLGEEIATLVDVDQQAGYYEERWDVSSFPRGMFASGAYFYRLTAESAGSSVFHELRKMVLVK